MKPFLTAKIVGQTFKYFLVDTLDKCKKCNKGTNSGECDFNLNRIRLVRLMKKEAQQETAFHETIHAAFPDWSEAKVQSTANVLYQVLKENKKLRNFIFPR